MLNELYTLECSLKRFNVVVEESHPWVKRLGRANLLIAGVDSSGLVTTIEHVDKQDAVKLFKIQESNHSNFPAVNWPSPIWHLDPQSPAVQDWLACSVGDVRRRIELLRNACDTSETSPGQDRALFRILEFSRELAPRFKGASQSDFAAFPTLMERLGGVTTPAAEWLRILSNAALDAAEAGPPAMLVTVETLLGGKLDKKTAQIDEAKVSILFDLADCTRFRYRVGNPKMGVFFSERLNATEAVVTGSGRCALTGLDMPLEIDKMPSPRLPVLGDTVLMSMNPDTPCQTRYGRIGSDIFPLGKKTASSLNAALIHLTAAEREGKNWKRIPGRTRKKFSLLLVYLESDPLLEEAIAEMFTGGEESDQLYTTVCTNVCKALSGRKASESDLLHLFVLNKIDPGRVQVELSDTFTAEQVIQGGEDWRRGASNRPPLPLWNDDLIPSPFDVMRCLQMKWERGGASYSDAPACRLADVYDVLVANKRSAESSARLLLRLTLQRTLDLLLAIGHAAHRGGKEGWKSISREAGNNPVVAVSLLGITLNKLGHRKESYMQEPAFLVGRFLSLADTLHAEYSKAHSHPKDPGEAVRSDLPPQLLGNALIPTAISNLNKGLARTSQRLRVYQAWARGKKGTGLARWSCSEMGKIASELAPQLFNRRLNEAEQAQLLLGYLAREEKKEDKDSAEGVNQ
ncbi:MAG: hypothetical protein JJE04_08065 [Acidobacteriia bacterium]|nr:hypothetical protein [Terriglobia bacterium]